MGLVSYILSNFFIFTQYRT